MDDDLFDDDDEQPGEGCIGVNPLRVGLTRPATMGGVPMKPLMFGFFGVAVVFLGTNNVFYLGLGFPVFFVLRWVSADYPRIFAEIAAWIRVNARCMNRTYWGVASFSPRRTHNWRDGYGFAA
jgi:type IV secretion system protein VirB3